jgi:hypothetical protein
MKTLLAILVAILAVSCLPSCALYQLKNPKEGDTFARPNGTIETYTSNQSR